MKFQFVVHDLQANDAFVASMSFPRPTTTGATDVP